MFRRPIPLLLLLLSGWSLMACTPPPLHPSDATAEAAEVSRHLPRHFSWSPTIGELRLFAGYRPLQGWTVADGRRVTAKDHPLLAAATFRDAKDGEGPASFLLPDPPPLTASEHESIPYQIALQGEFPPGTGEAQLGAGYLGEIRLWPGAGVPSGWIPCDGQLLKQRDHPELEAVLGSTYGGDYRYEEGQAEAYFAVPALDPVGDARFVICAAGHKPLPPPYRNLPRPMIDPRQEPYDRDAFIGEIRLFSSPLPPSGWRACNGLAYRISDNMSLFSLIGTRYGGDGRTTFRVPDMTLADHPELRYAIAIAGIYPGLD